RLDFGQPGMDFADAVRVCGRFCLSQKRCAFLVGRQHHVEHGFVAGRRFLRHRADACLARHVDRAGISPDMALDQVKQRGLARAVLADKARLCAGGDDHRRVLEQFAALNAVGEIGNGQHGSTQESERGAQATSPRWGRGCAECLGRWIETSRTHGNRRTYWQPPWPDTSPQQGARCIQSLLAAFSCNRTKGSAMIDARLALALVTAAGLAIPAYAQDQTPRLEDLDAKRINPFQILIDFEYGGSACEAIGRAEIGELVNGTLAVTFSANATSEVCTMQIEEHEIEQAIETED